MPKSKEPFPWILQELDAPPSRISRPYYQEEPIILPLEATEQLPDPRWQHIPLCEVLEASDYTTSPIEITTTISELGHMLRREVETPTTPEDTASTKNTTE